MFFKEILLSSNELGGIELFKKRFLENIDKFDLTGIARHRVGDAMGVILFNTYQLGVNFSRDETLLIIDKYFSTKGNTRTMDLLSSILYFKNTQNLKLEREDIVSLIKKYDLVFEIKNNFVSYDNFLNKNDNFLLKKDFVFIIFSKSLESINEKNQNIFITEVKSGLIIDDEKTIQKILETENKDIISCVYKHIDQIRWKHEELLSFLKNNNLKINNKAKKIFQL